MLIFKCNIYRIIKSFGTISTVCVCIRTRFWNGDFINTSLKAKDQREYCSGILVLTSTRREEAWNANEKCCSSRDVLFRCNFVIWTLRISRVISRWNIYHPMSQFYLYICRLVLKMSLEIFWEWRLWYSKWFLNTNEALKVFGINHQSAIPIEVTDSFHLWKYFKVKMISFRGQGKCLGQSQMGSFFGDVN